MASNGSLLIGSSFLHEKGIMSIFDRKKSQKQWREVRISAKITEGDCDVDFDEV